MWNLTLKLDDASKTPLFLQIAQQPSITYVFAGLCRERAMDQGRFTVFDGVADDGVMVGHYFG